MAKSTVTRLGAQKTVKLYKWSEMPGTYQNFKCLKTWMSRWYLGSMDGWIRPIGPIGEINQRLKGI